MRELLDPPLPPLPPQHSLPILLPGILLSSSSFPASGRFGQPPTS